jgi:hypothetical protein
MMKNAEMFSRKLAKSPGVFEEIFFVQVDYWVLEVAKNNPGETILRIIVFLFSDFLLHLVSIYTCLALVYIGTFLRLTWVNHFSFKKTETRINLICGQ